MHAEFQQLRRLAGVAGGGGDGLLVEAGEQERLAPGEGLGVGGGRWEVEGAAERGEDISDRGAGQRGFAQAAQGDTAGQAHAGFVAVGEGVQDVDGDRIGEVGNGEVGEFLGGALQVQAGADPDGRLAEQSEPAPSCFGFGMGALLVSDVEQGGDDADGPAAGVFDAYVGA